MKKRAALAGVGIVGLFLALAVGQAQPVPKFDVAAIKPCADTNQGRRSKGGAGSWSPGRLTLTCQTVMSLIQRAYVNFAYGRIHIWPPLLAIEGGPAWMNSGGFQIEAKSENAEGKGMMNGPMLQALLEDRFRLKIHRETREVPVYALTVAKGGPKIHPYKKGSCVVLENLAPEPGQPDALFCGMSEVTANGYKLYRTTIAEFATEFSARLDRPVIDKTGLAGVFNIDLDLTAADLHLANSRPGDAELPGSPPDEYYVFDAVRAALRKVGLNLESTKGPGEFLVIDSVERPSAN